MWTWDYRGFLIEQVLVLLEHIFDPKIWDFFKNRNFVTDGYGSGHESGQLLSEPLARFDSAIEHEVRKS